MSSVRQDYISKFLESPPQPYGIDEETLENVMREAIEKGEPIPPDFDFWADLPDDAVG